MAGMRSGKYVPRARNLVSTGLTPAALSLTSNSCPPLTVGGGSSRNARTSGIPCAVITIAFMCRLPRSHPQRSLAAQEVILHRHHVDQTREGSGLHLLHDVCTMDLHGAGAHVQFRR